MVGSGYHASVYELALISLRAPAVVCAVVCAVVFAVVCVVVFAVVCAPARHKWCHLCRAHNPWSLQTRH